MDEQNYSQWQILHRRHVAGETLNGAEQAHYEAGCQELDGMVNYEGDIPRMRKLRALIAEAQAEQQTLRHLENQLLAQIAEAEARLDPRSRQLLGIEH